MIAWLGQAAARPIRDPRGAFALAALLLVLATIVFATLAGGPRGEEPAPMAARVAAPMTPAGRVRTASRPAAPTSERVEAVALEFLAGYLAALYGRGPAAGIRHATAGLRARLTRRPVRVSPAARRRHPTIQRLEITPVERGERWRVVATISDGGVATYPIGLALARTARGVVVRVLLENQ